MRLKPERLTTLKELLKDIGLDYSDEQAQQAGLAIMRFALAKETRKRQLKLTKMEQKDDVSVSG
ncbi:MAG: hypothetical protein ACREGJ_01800 [Candidatus Saccharimonadales bacterium]